MSLDAILQVVTGWFAAAGAASMKLPHGWFGRPFDNRHQLTSARVMAGRLILELDGSMLLVLAHPTSAERSDGDVLRISGFLHGALSWDGYGGSVGDVETFGGGDVEFHG
jgi:hypothetical protein